MRFLVCCCIASFFICTCYSYQVGLRVSTKDLYSSVSRRSYALNVKSHFSASSLTLAKYDTIFSEEYWKNKDIPNKLTLSRVLAIPSFTLMFLLRKRAITLFIFIYTCLTDFFDGYLARRWNQTSPFGAFLDPVADKLMVATALILLTSLYPTLFFVVPVAVIMCREIGVSALREWMAERGVRSVVKVGMLGKIKTTLQMIAVTLLLLVFPDKSTDFDICGIVGLPKPVIFMAGLTTLYFSAIATVVSGYLYFKAALPSIIPKKEIEELPET